MTSSSDQKPPVDRTGHALTSGVWMGAGYGLQGLMTVGSVAVLARVLSPAEFGLVSAAMLAINFSRVFSEGAIAPAVVQHPKLRDEHIQTAFTLSLGTSVLLFMLLWLGAPTIAALLKAPSVAPVLRVLACLQPIAGLGVIADSLLRRELRFRTIANVRIVSYGVGYGGVGIVAALAGAREWALVAANATQAVLTTALLLRARPHSLRLGVDWPAARELLSFGGGFVLARIGNYAAGDGDNVVVAKWLGLSALGLYDRAYQLMVAPAMLLGQVMDEILFASLARIQDDRPRVSATYRQCIVGVAFAMLPLTIVAWTLAPEIVYVVLGPAWGGVTTPFRILALGTLFRTSYKISDSLTRALGAMYRRAWRQWAYAVFVIGGAIIGQHWGLAGVAWAVLLALAVNVLLQAHLVMKLVPFTWSDFLAAHGPALLTAAFLGLPALATALLLRDVLHLPPLAVLGGTLAVVCALLAAVLAFWRRRFLGRDGTWLVAQIMEFSQKPLRRMQTSASGVQ
ncbi:MAG: lipopolysaccharide biosynthesis protein [Gemmatimonadetes bacterium]|nr:MAG: lipopolysaccharide biosynthesis protein [Gemmatimonadota bacterium]PYP25787.1 MAG: lipopolysaccharide biosynthesis protein [Gemmatimonadota bacterium]